MNVLDTPVGQRLLRFIELRERARETKELFGGNGPHSEDPIIAKYRFCNINREHDTVTQWVAENVRFPYALAGTNTLVVQLLVARIFNEPDVLELILPVTDTRETCSLLKAHRAAGCKIMRGAYMMPVHGNSGRNATVEEYYLRAVEGAQKVDWHFFSTLEQVAEALMRQQGIGEFLANQVCTDLRYTPQFERASDWETFVLCGPGTRRGIDRLLGKTEDLGRQKQKFYCAMLRTIREALKGYVNRTVRGYFRDPNNLSNTFCEFDKYERLLADPTASLRLYN